MHDMIGYGTFITNREYNLHHDPRPVIVRGFRRVWRPGWGYPYVLKDPAAGFWGILFSVDDAGLARLDGIEGLGYLYNRIEAHVLTEGGHEVQAWIYVPTSQTIRRVQLTLEMDAADGWLGIIRNSPAIEDFPVLGTKAEPEGPQSPCV